MLRAFSLLGTAPPSGRRGRSDLLDQLHLGAVRGFEEADAAAVVGRHLFEDAHAVARSLARVAGVVVGVEGDVLDAVMLLVVLRGDDRR